MDRREFVAGAVSVYVGSRAAVAYGLGRGSAGAVDRGRGTVALENFEYRGVRLLPGQFLDQVKYARDVFFNLSNDDLLLGFRKAAGLPAPGTPMKGWARKDCSATFGQWLSGMARLSCATGDTALRDKAIALAQGWEKTIAPDGDPRMEGWSTYSWEKISCGLVDLALYADYSHAMEVDARITDWASKNFDRSRSPATPQDRDGRRPHGTLEWYTLPENSLRAYLITGDKKFLEFAKLWTYDSYWNKFENSKRPEGVAFLHSYSHINTFSSAAMMYRVTGDPRYLRIVKNAYDWARETQTYASGGYGPGEWSVPPDGTLGRALDLRYDTAEIPCGTWGGFKMTHYLTTATGEARYGDWVETLLYNGMGAVLPLHPDGVAFYYANYRMGMGQKAYFWDEWPCCSGTYIQNIAAYHDIIYYKDAQGLAVNLFVPSEAEWEHGGQAVKVLQETAYPADDTTKMTVTMERPAEMTIKFRVPAWTKQSTVMVNGAPVNVKAVAGEWAEVRRTWKTGDVMSVKLPMELYVVPVDVQQPRRVAVKYGPVMMAQEAAFTYPVSGDGSDIAQQFEREGSSLHFKSSKRNEASGQHVGPLRPFWEYAERQPYRVYFDLDDPRFL